MRRWAAVFVLVAFGFAVPTWAQRGGGGGHAGGGGGFHGGGFSAPHFSGGFSGPHYSGGFSPRYSGGFSPHSGGFAPSHGPAFGPRYSGSLVRPAYTSHSFMTRPGMMRPGPYTGSYSYRGAAPISGNRAPYVGAQHINGHHGDGHHGDGGVHFIIRSAPFFPYSYPYLGWIGLPWGWGWGWDNWDNSDFWNDDPPNNSGTQGYQVQPDSVPQDYQVEPNSVPQDTPSEDTDQPSYRPEYQPMAAAAAPPAQVPENSTTTTIVFKDGRPPEQIHNYAMTNTTLFVFDQQHRDIPLDELDLAATTKVNRDAGVEFKVPQAVSP